MAKYVNVKLNSGGYAVLPVILEGNIQTDNGCYLGIISNPVGTSIVQLFADAISATPEESAANDFVVDRIDMQKDCDRDLVGQLRDLADVIEKSRSTAH